MQSGDLEIVGACTIRVALGIIQMTTNAAAMVLMCQNSPRARVTWFYLRHGTDVAESKCTPRLRMHGSG